MMRLEREALEARLREDIASKRCVRPWCGWCQADATPGQCAGYERYIREHWERSLELCERFAVKSRRRRWRQEVGLGVERCPTRREGHDRA